MVNKYNELKSKLDQTLLLGLEFKNNVYYMVNEDKKEDPYCSCCYDFYDKLVRLHSIFDEKEGHDIYICPKCKTKVRKVFENE